MKHQVIRRPEMADAILDLGGAPIELADYATTGLLAVAIGPRGHGKTNAGLVIAEQLSKQGWVACLVDPERELESLYGDAVANPDELLLRLEKRDKPILVVSARDATEFVPYGRAILAAADQHRKPLFLVVDEGQVFSAPRKRKDDIGEASDLLNACVERGRKRALDLMVTAHRLTGSLHRTIFGNKNLTLIGCQADTASWAALAPQFRASKIDFADLNALQPGEFMCISRRAGIERVRMPMAAALARVAPKARPIKPAVPTTFTQWSQAISEIPSPRLALLTDPVVNLLGAVAGLTAQEMLAGFRALQDELETRV